MVSINKNVDFAWFYTIEYQLDPLDRWKAYQVKIRISVALWDYQSWDARNNSTKKQFRDVCPISHGIIDYIAVSPNFV